MAINTHILVASLGSSLRKSITVVTAVLKSRPNKICLKILPHYYMIRAEVSCILKAIWKKNTSYRTFDVTYTDRHVSELFAKKKHKIFSQFMTLLDKLKLIQIFNTQVCIPFTILNL